jgi:hypothetical protein
MASRPVVVKMPMQSLEALAAKCEMLESELESTKEDLAGVREDFAVADDEKHKLHYRLETLQLSHDKLQQLNGALILVSAFNLL